MHRVCCGSPIRVPRTFFPRTCFWGGCLLLVGILIGAPHCAFSQGPSRHGVERVGGDGGSAKGQVKDSKESDDPMVREINAIREQLGGGIRAQLEGIVPSPQASPLFSPDQMQQAFDRKLVELKEAKAREKTANGPHHSSSELPRTGPERGCWRPDVRDDDRRRPRHVRPLLKKKSGPQVALRQAARRLEETAAFLEEAGCYDEADDVRDTAIKFWRKARDFSPQTFDKPTPHQSR